MHFGNAFAYLYFNNCNCFSTQLQKHRNDFLMYPENEFEKNMDFGRLLAEYEARFADDEEEPCSSAVGDVFFEAPAYLHIIEHYELEGEALKAMEAAEYAIAQHRYSIDLYLKLAQLLIDTGQPALATEVLESARAISPEEEEIELLQAEVLIREGRRKEALQLLDLLKDQADPARLSDIYLIEALAYEAEEAYERMFYTLQQAVTEDPSNEEALERLGACAIQSKRFEESVAFHEALLEEDAYLVLAWYNLAQAQVYLGHYEAAVEAYELAFAIDEHCLQACRDCADLCLELKNFNKALACYLELLEHQGSSADSDLFIQIGYCYLQLDRPQAAITFYARSAQLDPLNDEIFFAIGECHAAEGQWGNAVQYFEKAIGIEPEREEYFAALGEAYFNLGNQEMAIEHLEEAISLNDLEARYWILLATFLMDNKEGERALEVLEEGMEIVPGAEILYCRIACLFALAQRNAALYWLSEALIEDFEMHVSLFELLPELEWDSEVLALIASHAI